MNTLGRNFRVSVFGESHGPAIGTLIDGVPAGIGLCKDDFIADLNRRRSGAFGTTARTEADYPQLLSGVCQGRTTGAPIAIVFRNEDIRSSDYSLFRDVPRPGHADYAASQKWGGFNDLRGGGHFSGRLTLAAVAAGVIAKKILNQRFGDRFCILASITELGGISCDDQGNNDPDVGLWRACLEEAAGKGDSVGAVVGCRVSGVPIGLGNPFFDSVESLISHAIFSIPGIRAIAFGDGFEAARMRGSEHNDPLGKDGRPLKNGAGGVSGGLTNGGDIVFRVAVKPTSSIAAPQRTYNFAAGEEDTLIIGGRHDVCFALRTPVIVEAMTAIVLADL